MSVIGTVEAVPNRLQIIWEILHEAGSKGVERDALERQIAPQSIDASEAVFSESLSELNRSGIAKTMKNRVILCDSTAKSFVHDVETHLLSADIDLETDQGKLAGAICWLLTRDPIQPLEWKNAPVRAIRRDFDIEDSRFDITNYSRWQNLVYWARYLGYANVAEFGGQRMLIPNPTQALRRWIQQALPTKKVTLVDSFFENLAGHSPLFEGGPVRKAIEAQLIASRGRDPNALSFTTSLALRQLQLSGEITLLHRDDAKTWMAPNLGDGGQISHFKRN